MPAAETIPISVNKGGLPSIVAWLDTHPRPPRLSAYFIEHDAPPTRMLPGEDPILDLLRTKFQKVAKRRRGRQASAFLDFEIRLSRDEAAWLAKQVTPAGMFGAEGRRRAIAALPFAVRDLCAECRTKVMRRRGRPKLYSYELRRTVEGSGPLRSERQLQRRRARWRKQQAWAEAVESRPLLGALYQNAPD